LLLQVGWQLGWHQLRECISENYSHLSLFFLVFLLAISSFPASGLASILSVLNVMVRHLFQKQKQKQKQNKTTATIP